MTFMEEMMQQPHVLRTFVQRTYENTTVKSRIEELIQTKKIDRIIFTGMGSSLYACYIPADYLRKKGIMSLVAESAEILLWGNNLFTETTLIVAVSQSGESPEVLELVKRLPHPDNLIIVTNYPASKLYSMGKVVIDIFAGVEHLTSTKTYTNSVAGLIYLAYVLAGESDDIHAEYNSSLLTCADKMEFLLSDEKTADRMAEFISDIKFLLCAGSGYSYSLAAHAEIVVEEAGKFYSSRYTFGQFLHGPIELINSGFGVIVFDFDPQTRQECGKVVDNVLNYYGKVLLVTNNMDLTEKENLFIYPVDYHDCITSPIIGVIPIEMAINRLCILRGESPGRLMRVRKRIAE